MDMLSSFICVFNKTHKLDGATCKKSQKKMTSQEKHKQNEYLSQNTCHRISFQFNFDSKIY